MKTLLMAFSGVVVAALSSSCMSTLGRDGSVNASTYIGAPERIERILKTDGGFAFEVIYRNKEAQQKLVTTTDSLGRKPKFADSDIEGVPIKFERVISSEFHSRRTLDSPTGTYPYGFVTSATRPSESVGMAAGAYILTTPDYLVSAEFPREKPDWAARVSQTPGAILRDTALLPIMVPIAILTPRIDG